jgi:hypothetical protein
MKAVSLCRMNLMTAVNIKKDYPSLSHENKLLMLGSCFSENMGEKLKSGGFAIDINPFGILYNPMSIAKALEEIREGVTYSSDKLFEHEGLWHSFMHHGSFSSNVQAEVIDRINARLSQAHTELSAVDRVLITFGTAYIYKYKGQVVANCHKLPESSFERSRTTVAEIVDRYTPLLKDWFREKPQLAVIFTVSPIRYLRDGLHESQLSKGILLLAIDELQRLFPNNIFYFPAFEIMMDELRDYRFYADDMLHPSTMAVDYIWERFSSAFFNAETLSVVEECEKIHKALSHRPLHPEDKAYKEFLGQIVLKINRLKEKYTYLDIKI